MPAIPSALVDRAKTGDPEAFEAALKPLEGPGFRLAFGLLLDRTDAEDALQEAIVTAWRRVGNVRDGSALGPWFLAIVANKCRRARARRWAMVLTPGRATIEKPADWSGSGEDLRRAVRRLDYGQRLVVVLHFYLDLTLEQVAQTLGVPLGTVKSRLHRAMTTLRADPALAEATI